MHSHSSGGGGILAGYCVLSFTLGKWRDVGWQSEVE